MSVIQQFFKEHGISEVEAIIPDMAGVPRGKIMPAAKFAEEEGMRLPESIFLQTVTGEYPDDDRAISPSEIDIVLKADPSTIRVVPWAAGTDGASHSRQLLFGRPSGHDGAALCVAARSRAVRPTRLGAGGGPRTRVLSRRAEHRRRLSAEAAGRPLGTSGDRSTVVFDRGGQRIRSAVRRRVCVLRSAGHRDRHADPRRRRRADGDQSAARQCVVARRPGVSVQAHRARSGVASQDVCDVHGEAHGARTRQRDAYPPEHRRSPHRRTTFSAMPKDVRRRCSSRTSPGCRSTCRPPCRCSRRT